VVNFDTGESEHSRGRNIVLIGMPGSGKSTIGARLAGMLGYAYLDTDALIERVTGRSLQEIVDDSGYLALRDIEEKVLLSVDLTRHVFSTGGSAVYGRAAMAHLKMNGVIVFLDVELETLRKRIRNFDERGIAKRPGQSFEDLYRERFPLYVEYADITIDATHLSVDEICEKIVEELEKERNRVTG